MNKYEQVVRRVFYKGNTDVSMDVIQENEQPTAYLIMCVQEYDDETMSLNQDQAVDLFDFLADALGYKTERNT